MATTIRFTSFPQTKPPPEFVSSIVEVFRNHEPLISTITLAKGLESDPVLKELAGDLANLGFVVETAKATKAKIPRPVFYGENGVPSLRYDIDAYHPLWRCGLEVEAGRAILGNAIFRDLASYDALWIDRYRILASNRVPYYGAITSRCALKMYF